MFERFWTIMNVLLHRFWLKCCKN